MTARQLHLHMSSIHRHTSAAAPTDSYTSLGTECHALLQVAVISSVYVHTLLDSAATPIQLHFVGIQAPDSALSLVHASAVYHRASVHYTAAPYFHLWW